MFAHAEGDKCRYCRDGKLRREKDGKFICDTCGIAPPVDAE